jgi:hypothetical protein
MVSGEGLMFVETDGSNPALGMNVCTLYVYVMLSQTKALRRAEQLSKDSYDVCGGNDCVIENALALQRRCNTCLFQQILDFHS